MAAGRRVILPRVGLFADGVAVRQIGKETFRVARKLVDEVILVTTDEICAAIKDVFDDTRSVAEPAGALAIAGIKKYVAREKANGQTLIGILSGANVNFDRLRHIAERAEVGEQREALFAVQIPGEAGQLPGLLPRPGQAQHHRIQLSLFGSAAAPRCSVASSCEMATSNGRSWSSNCSGRGSRWST